MYAKFEKCVVNISIIPMQKTITFYHEYNTIYSCFYPGLGLLEEWGFQSCVFYNVLYSEHVEKYGDKS
jgi:hypothetical protein